MSKMLVSIPDPLNNRFKALVPARQRSLFLVRLLEKAIEKKEMELYECAKKVEADKTLNKEMGDWDVTVGDGLE